MEGTFITNKNWAKEGHSNSTILASMILLSWKTNVRSLLLSSLNHWGIDIEWSLRQYTWAIGYWKLFLYLWGGGSRTGARWQDIKQREIWQIPYSPVFCLGRLEVPWDTKGYFPRQQEQRWSQSPRVLCSSCSCRQQSSAHRCALAPLYLQDKEENFLLIPQ